MNEFPGEDQRVQDLIEECEHEHGVLVCLECGKPLPGPADGIDLFEGEEI